MSPVRDLHPSLTGYLHQRLSAFQDGFRHNLALLGPVGSGKTTLLQQVLSDSTARVVKIACPLQRDSVPGFVKRFATATLRGALGLAEASAIPHTAEAARQLERYSSGHLQAEAFVHALDLIPVLHRELNQPCVLVLDEFLHLDDLGLSHAFHELGKRVMTWPFAMFWVSSSADCRARVILRERLQLLFGQFELLTLGPVETAAATAWMQQECPALAHGADLSRFLLHWIGSSPWYLSLFLRRMHELTRLKRGQKATEAMLIETCWDVLGSPDGPLHQWCAAQVGRIVQQRHGPLAREALIAVAQGARTTQAIAQRYGSRRHLSEALQLLVEHDMVQRKGACWVIPDQLLTCWLASGAGSSQGLHDRHAAQIAFQQALWAIWTQWMEAAGQSLAVRIERLFSQFDDETVSLDHKTGRLPAFHQMNYQPTPRAEESYLVAEGEERRWCCLVHEGRLDESGIAAFEQFCGSQVPRPSRKIVVARAGLELNAKLLAKEANMWVWEPEDVSLLCLLYGQPPLSRE